ncbi:MAG: response regulator transcription factor [Deltaproteobacteria bacterium]|nr:response regulator transcription factor [Deltaproteobacteria bacterium]MCW5807672.1 response regulator transcription factor [Deltaproteobacteria bacterium]
MSGLAALIVEDEARARGYLAELLRATGAFERLAEAPSAAEATRALLAATCDVAFVDIRLVERPGDLSGLEWVRGVATAPNPPRFVFTTALPDHALAAFEAGAVDYLLKPYTTRRVGACVQRLLARDRPPPVPAAAEPPRLVARTSTGIVLLAADRALAFEAADRLTYVHHEDGRFNVDASLAALQAQLGPSILRCHRNWLVAPRHVRRLERRSGELVLLVGASLIVPVARDRAGEVRQALVAGAIG